MRAFCFENDCIINIRFWGWNMKSRTHLMRPTENGARIIGASFGHYCNDQFSGNCSKGAGFKTGNLVFVSAVVKRASTASRYAAQWFERRKSWTMRRGWKDIAEQAKVVRRGLALSSDIACWISNCFSEILIPQTQEVKIQHVAIVAKRWISKLWRS